MKEIIAIANQKGGVGKSTTADAISAGLSRRGERVLAIDMDAKGDLSKTCCCNMNGCTVNEVLLGKCRLQHAIQHLGGGSILYDIIPSSSKLTMIDQPFMQIKTVGLEEILKEKLKEIADAYDYVIIDTPPALGWMLTNALVACTNVIIPAEAEEYSVLGLEQLGNTLLTVKKYRNPDIWISGILLTKYSRRTNLSKNMMKKIEIIAQDLKTNLFNTHIRRCVAVGESQLKHRSLIEYQPLCTTSTDYISFIDEYVSN